MAYQPFIKHIFAATSRITERTRRFIHSQSTGRLYLVGGMILFVSMLFGALVLALNNALFFDGHAENGAFQLLNPLRRMVDGQVLGRDFNFFHGIGTPWVHLPAYLLFGQGIFGSEMARWLVSPVVFVALSFCFFYALRRNIKFAFNMSMIVTAISVIFIPFLPLPLTSILGVRSGMAVFLMAIMIGCRRLERPALSKGPQILRNFSWYEVVTGVILAFGVVCGTEFGIAAILAYLIVQLVYPTHKGWPFKKRVLSCARVIAVFLPVLMIVLGILTMGHPLTPLKYALFDITSDQMWYFGVPPNRYLHMGNLLQIISGDYGLLLMLAVTLGAVWLIVRLHRIKTDRVIVQAFIFGILAGAFALVSMLGYYSNTQAGPLMRMAILIGVAELYLLAVRRRSPIRLGLEWGKFKKRINLQMPDLWRKMAGVFVLAAIIYGVVIFVLVKANFDIVLTFKKAADYVAGTDNDVLGQRWSTIAEQIVPIVEADNYVGIVDFNDNGFMHGISPDKKQVIVDPGSRSSFIHHGQIIYLKKSGRQIIADVKQRSDGKMLVTLQNKDEKQKEGFKLDPAIDGLDGKMIVSENFNHDNSKVWSMYTGLLNEEMGVVHPSQGGYDYVIHALGKQRRHDYLDDFNRIKPQFVTTFTHQYSGWESWLVNEHWDFYSVLDKNYEVVQETSVYALWKRKDQSWQSNGYEGVKWTDLPYDEKSVRFTLPKIDFSNADVNEYNHQEMQRERDRKLMMGRDVDLRPYIDQDKYDEYLIGQIRNERQYELYKRENNGEETKIRLKDLDKQRAKGSKKSPGLDTVRPKRQLVMVKLKYQASYPLGWLPVIGKTSRFMLEPNNTYSQTAISLRPYENEVVFPLIISEFNEDSYFSARTYSLFPGNVNLKITGAEWAVLDTSVANLKTLTD